MSQFFLSGGQSIRVLASASVLPMNIQDYEYSHTCSYHYVGLEGTHWEETEEFNFGPIWSVSSVESEVVQSCPTL